MHRRFEKIQMIKPTAGCMIKTTNKKDMTTTNYNQYSVSA